MRAGGDALQLIENRVSLLKRQTSPKKRAAGVQSGVAGDVWIVFARFAVACAAYVTGCCPNLFSLVLRRFLTNLGLAPGDSKTLRAADQTVGIANLPRCQGLSAKNVSMNRTKRFRCGQHPVWG